MLTREAFITTSSTPEDAVAECKRRAKECYALLESAIAPEYRQALSAMAVAWMKIAQSEEKIQQKSAPRRDCAVGSASILCLAAPGIPKRLSRPGQARHDRANRQGCNM
jgi:hypothetical protein